MALGKSLPTWSHPLLGHINVINSPDYTDAIRTGTLNGIDTWISGHTAAFGMFNHPPSSVCPIE